MNLTYTRERRLSVDEFVDVLKRSSLGERRPVRDRLVMEAMLHHANLLWTAWDDGKLMGIARSLTDFEYCCYLSDLAVDEAYQRRGIGRELIRRTQGSLGPKAKIILLAAPKAVDYYPKVGFERHASAWTLPARPPLE